MRGASFALKKEAAARPAAAFFMVCVSLGGDVQCHAGLIQDRTN
jgi:hypothetical protein